MGCDIAQDRAIYIIFLFPTSVSRYISSCDMKMIPLATACLNLIWALGIPKMYMGALGYKVLRMTCFLCNPKFPYIFLESPGSIDYCYALGFLGPHQSLPWLMLKDYVWRWVFSILSYPQCFSTHIFHRLLLRLLTTCLPTIALVGFTTAFLIVWVVGPMHGGFESTIRLGPKCPEGEEGWAFPRIPVHWWLGSPKLQMSP